MLDLTILFLLSCSIVLFMMVELDHSNTILIVKPVGSKAINVIRAEGNADRLGSFHFDNVIRIAEHGDIRSRECTPYFARPPEPQLLLKFYPEPKNWTRGFVFGTDDEKCDVPLLDNGEYHLSGQHFYIDFNWDSGFLRLNNNSRNGTGIRAPSVENGYQMLKHNKNNMHMLHPAEHTKVYVGALEFELSLPHRGKHQREYEKNWEIFRGKYRKAVPMINGLDIRSTEITPYMVRRESRCGVYFLHENIGKGHFGTVRKASEQYTAEVYAAKEFGPRKPRLTAQAVSEMTILQKVKHVGVAAHKDPPTFLTYCTEAHCELCGLYSR